MIAEASKRQRGELEEIALGAALDRRSFVGPGERAPGVAADGEHRRAGRRWSGGSIQPITSIAEGRMNRWMKLTTVLAGYALAVLVSVVTVAIDDRRFTPADNQTMGGMIAGGEMMYGCAIFLL